MNCLASDGSMPKILRQSESREPVDDSEVHDLGLAAMIGGDHQRRHAEDLRGGESVDVVAAAVGFDQQRIFREVSQQAQFDLRIVRGQQHVAGFDGEGGANLAAQFGADGNVLQIRIGRRQPSGRRAGLAEGGVQTAGGGIQQRGQSIHVSRLEF